MKKSNCNKCKNLLHYMWIGEGYKRDVKSCREHLPLNTKDCRLYKEKEDDDEGGMIE